MMGMAQLELRTGEELDLNDHVDARGIRYIGKAYALVSGMWLCLADVGGMLCRVEVKITKEPHGNEAET